MITIAEVERGSIAEELELRIGTRIVRINGAKVRDGIDLTFLLADGELELETVDPDGHRVIYEVDRDPGEPMGIVPAPDTVREGANKCVFCFIDGNPQGVRDTLWIRDDDFRLSFSYGSYVTLTNLGPRGLGRLVEQRLSPLYVSVHVTDPEVRVRMLKNDRPVRGTGGTVEHLNQLAGHAATNVDRVQRRDSAKRLDVYLEAALLHRRHAHRCRTTEHAARSSGLLGTFIGARP